MGDLKVAETFQDAVFITSNATGLGVAALVPTCTFVKIADGTRTVGTVQDVGFGWYRVTDFTNDAAGSWTTEWAVAGAYTIHGKIKEFKVGLGQLQDVFARLGAPAGASIAADLATIDALIDGIVADIGVFPTANYATLAAYVEDIRARLVVILADVTGINGDAMRGTDGAALAASWTAALATILGNFTALRIGYLDELDFDLQGYLDALDTLLDGIIADIGVFPTANYATVAAYVEDIRTRLIAILADVTGLAGAAMRGTDGAALVASGWDAALATILDNFTAVRIGYLDELDFDLVAALGALATEAKQDIIDTNVDTLITRVTAAVATEAKQDIIDTNVDTLITRVTAAVALASVLGAVTDAAAQDADSNVFTAMQHIKGLHDVLWDDAGVAAWPAGAAPANGVSLAEAIRQIFDDVVVIDEFHDVPAQNAVANAQMNEVIGNKTDTVAGTSIVAVIKQILVDTGTTLENRQDAIQTTVNAITNTELFGSVMQEEIQIGAAAADLNLPDIILPNITGTIQRAYLHFKVRMVENLYEGVNKLDGAQSIRIKTDGGAWGVDDIPAITFVDDMIQLASLTREAGDVWGGMIDVSSEVDSFNDTYEMRWEDADADQDFINFNDIEMFLRIVWI